MDLQRTASTAGVVACLLLVVVGFAPAVLVDATGVGAYYAAGPVGLTAVGFLALVGVVVFLSGRQGRAEPATVAGVTVVLGAALAGLSALWAVSIDPTLLFSFPSEYAWLENHRWTVVVVALAIPVAAGVYARATV